jgi:hypothetical protein
MIPFVSPSTFCRAKLTDVANSVEVVRSQQISRLSESYGVRAFFGRRLAA